MVIILVGLMLCALGFCLQVAQQKRTLERTDVGRVAPVDDGDPCDSAGLMRGLSTLSVLLLLVVGAGLIVLGFETAWC